MAKIAGTLSTAKIRSTISISTSATNSGVTQSTLRPVAGSGWRTKKRCPRSSGVMRRIRRSSRRTGLLSTSGILSPSSSILMPVAIRNTAKT